MGKHRIYLNLLILIADYFLVLGSFSVAYKFREFIDGVALIEFNQFVIFALVAALLYVVIFAYLGLYSNTKKADLVDQLITLIIGSVTATALAGAGIYFGKQFDYSRLVIGIGLIITVFSTYIFRIITYQIEKYLYERDKLTTRLLVIGTGQLLEMALKGFIADREQGYRVVGVLVQDLNDNERINAYSNIENLGMYDEKKLNKFVTEKGVDEVVFAGLGNAALYASLAAECEEMGIRFLHVPDIYDTAVAKLVTRDVAGMPVIELRPTELEGWMVVVKRLIDLVLSSIALIVLSPLFLIVAIAIKLDSRGPVFFIHHRVGKHGKEFGVIKFRSMAMIQKDGQLLHSSANEQIEKIKEQQDNYKLKDDPRITRVGSFIRKTSIDEFPQLINVVKGEMSLVGPRAYIQKELDTQLEKYPETKTLVRRLLTVKPGCTGLWQISGRSNIIFTERVAMDAHYASSANIWDDFKIMFKTVPVVIKGSGAM